MDYPVIHQSYQFGSYQVSQPRPKKRITLPVHCRYCTTRDVLQMYGITAPTLSRWQKLRGFPKPKIYGNPNRYLKEDIAQWENDLGRGKVIEHQGCT
ncbi:hypothetical protein [Algicola sagamiensis]|uniref:hypothetical protein n=1 Tax=Algicola sagamiensis TaxID=163869 RepID=UPI00037EEC2C|nr:hypothetical protein [Algicola sagamiensis]